MGSGYWRVWSSLVASCQRLSSLELVWSRKYTVIYGKVYTCACTCTCTCTCVLYILVTVYMYMYIVPVVHVHVHCTCSSCSRTQAPPKRREKAWYTFAHARNVPVSSGHKTFNGPFFCTWHEPRLAYMHKRAIACRYMYMYTYRPLYKVSIVCSFSFFSTSPFPNLERA